MEKKLEKMEHRMLLLERFVEMRFCESFRDFSARNTRLGGTTTNSNPGNREDLITEVLQRLQGAELQHGKGSRFQSELSPSPPAASPPSSPPPTSPPNSPPPSYHPQEASSSRSSRRIAARKLNARPLPSPTVLPTPTVKLTRVNIPSSDPLESTTPVVIKQSVESERDEELNEEDDYFSYVGGGDDGPPVDDDHSADFDPEDISEEETGNTPKKRKTTQTKSNPRTSYASTTPLDLKKVELTKEKLTSLLHDSVIPETADSKQCEICNKFWKLSVFPKHMLMHTKERTLKCSFCEKMFFNTSMLRKHEKKHQPDKFGTKCRVGDCSKLFTRNDKQLSHEKTCIRQALENGVEVAVEVMEDVKRRSRCTEEQLKWPTEPGVKGPKQKGKFCAHCKIWIEKGWNEHHQQLHSKWKCPLCPEENRRKYGLKSKLVQHMVKFHNKNKSEAEETGGADEEALTGELEDGDRPTQKMDVDEI